MSLPTRNPQDPAGKNSFISFRRHLLDQMLQGTPFSGRVLDVGGKKENKRGSFRPPLHRVESWEYLNVDASTNPDYCCSASSIPVEDGSFDLVLMTEVLEHLDDPGKVLKESYRVLNSSGTIIATIPFLVAIHADPHDYRRWTPEEIRSEFGKAGFEIKRIVPMGGLFAVIYDLLHVSLGMGSKKSRALKNRVARRVFMPLLAKLFLPLDRHYAYKSEQITTGFFIEGGKHLET